jgi:hypothetical protein
VTTPRRCTSCGRRAGDRDPVLHQHLRVIDVGAGLEGDGDRQIAVAGRLRGDVEHVVDAVHLLLDRRGDSLRHGLGRRARISGGDGHGRRHDVRVLRDRKAEIGDPADQRDDDGDDRRKDRARDEETREAHGISSAPPGAWV